MTQFLSIKNAFLFAVPYGFAIASIYLHIFWRAVRLNPFSYATTADLIPGTIGGLVIVLPLLSIGYFIQAGLLARYVPEAEPFSRKPWLNRVAIALLVCCAIAAYWLSGVFTRPGMIAIVTGTLLAGFTVGIGTGSGAASRWFPTNWHAVGFSLLIFMVPAITVGAAQIDSHSKLDPKTGIHVDTSRSELNVATEGTVLYVGKIGQTHVLNEVSTRSTILIPDGARILFSAKRQTESKIPRR